jgi:hypothetical protein
MLYEKQDNNGTITFVPVEVPPSENAIGILADYKFICQNIPPTQVAIAVELLRLAAETKATTRLLK